MARRLCLYERARIEAMAKAGFGAGEIAQRLGRHRSTLQRELARGGGPQGYRAEAAHKAAGERAGRPRVPKLARDFELASAVAERLDQRWSPHAISADLGAGLARNRIASCFDRPGVWVCNAVSRIVQRVTVECP